MLVEVVAVCAMIEGGLDRTQRRSPHMAWRSSVCGRQRLSRVRIPQLDRLYSRSAPRRIARFATLHVSFSVTWVISVNLRKSVCSAKIWVWSVSFPPLWPSLLRNVGQFLIEYCTSRLNGMLFTKCTNLIPSRVPRTRRSTSQKVLVHATFLLQSLYSYIDMQL